MTPRRLICCLALLAAAAPWVGGCRRRAPAPAADDRPPGARVKVIYPAAPGSFVHLADQLAASLVLLSADVSVKGGAADHLLSAGVEGVAPSGPLGQALRRSLGTGVIVDAAGTVLTSARVLRPAAAVFVQLRGGQGPRLPARVLGQDERSDVGLLTFPPPPGTVLRPAKLGDSDSRRVGAWGAALGRADPLGHGVTLSAGGVFSDPAARQAPGQLGPWAMIQTAAAVNGSNAGGALCNMQGEVVGINSLLPGAAPGVSFAVPINLAQRVRTLLQQKGKVVRTWVGVYLARVTEERARAVGLEQARGALVTSVLPDGPADRAGLRVGDIVVSFDDQPVSDAAQLSRLAGLAGGERGVPVGVWREGQLQRVTLKPEQLP